MLILIGTVPTAYALNHAVGKDDLAIFSQQTARAEAVLEKHDGGAASSTGDARTAVTAALRQRQVTPEMVPALHQLIAEIKENVVSYGSLDKVPYDQTVNVRNDMFLTSEGLSLLRKSGTMQVTAAEGADLAKL